MTERVLRRAVRQPAGFAGPTEPSATPRGKLPAAGISSKPQNNYQQPPLSAYMENSSNCSERAGCISCFVHVFAVHRLRPTLVGRFQTLCLRHMLAFSEHPLVGFDTISRTCDDFLSVVQFKRQPRVLRPGLSTTSMV